METRKATGLSAYVKASYRVLKAFDKFLLKKRSIIEPLNDPLKNIFSLEHSRHQSLINLLVNAVAA